MHVSAKFADDYHSKFACTYCHGGDYQTEDKVKAHAGLIADPSADMANSRCVLCHESTITKHKQSIHFNQTGYFTSYTMRSGKAPDQAYMNMFNKACATCHTTCGQCHISQPKSVKGGLLDGHVFKKTPNVIKNCTACHGSRVGEEFKGDRSGYKADVHYLKGMNCVNCHDGEEMHASNGPHRYETESNHIACRDCHSDYLTSSDKVIYHNVHQNKVQCQVCHSQAYKNCYQCHVGKGTQKPSQIDFRIGKNPRKGERFPYEYVLLRHIPIVPETYQSAELSLPNYTAYPTWELTTPHNIQRKTPQTDGCNNCHTNKDVFLTQEHIDSLITAGFMIPDEIEANKDVITEVIPSPSHY
jgi:hypothetical protein